MRNILFFESKEKAEEFRKEHPNYSRLDHQKTPYVDDQGKEYYWTLTWTF